MARTVITDRGEYTLFGLQRMAERIGTIGLAPLLDRGRYDDEEWALARAGLCNWVTEFGMAPRRIVYCGRSSDPKAFYRCCARHDRQARDESPTYGT